MMSDTTNRLLTKFLKVETKLKDSLRAIKRLLPDETAQVIQISPVPSTVNVSQDGATALPQTRADRLHSDVSTKTLWSGQDDTE